MKIDSPKDAIKNTPGDDFNDAHKDGQSISEILQVQSESEMGKKEYTDVEICGHLLTQSDDGRETEKVMIIENEFEEAGKKFEKEGECHLLTHSDFEGEIKNLKNQLENTRKELERVKRAKSFKLYSQEERDSQFDRLDAIERRHKKMKEKRSIYNYD